MPSSGAKLLRQVERGVEMRRIIFAYSGPVHGLLAVLAEEIKRTTH